jgi:ATP-dependent DNA helicase HFM1/MER3
MSEVSTSAVGEKYSQIFGFKSFNRIQSSVFDKVMNRDKNIILCAPTGSGKTVVAELAIISAVKHNMEPILMLYVSPLRALCQEKVKEWNERMAKIGISVQEYTGDSANKLPSNLQCHTLLCTTPEKIDFTTRSWKKRAEIFSRINLVIIDEVHTLGDKRGATLEAMISRLICISDNMVSKGLNKIRIIALSATVPNYKDIAKWIRADDPEESNFDDSYRSTPIKTYVFGYKSAMNDWMFEGTLTNKVASIIKQYSNNMPTLIFCCTRKSCEKTASRLVIDLPRLPAPQNVKCHDKTLELLLKKGVGYHTAGLSQDDREVVEGLL